MGPMFVTVGTNVEEEGSIHAVRLGVGACTCLESRARFAALFLHWFLLGSLDRLFVGEPEELGLDGFLLGQEELSCTDGVPVHSVRPLQLFMLHHEQNLLVSAAHEVSGAGGGVAHERLQVEDAVSGDFSGWSHGDSWQEDLEVTLHKVLHRKVVVVHQCPVFGSQTFLWCHWAVRGGFWCNPPGVAGSASSTPLSRRLAFLED